MLGLWIPQMNHWALYLLIVVLMFGLEMCAGLVGVMGMYLYQRKIRYTSLLPNFQYYYVFVNNLCDFHMNKTERQLQQEHAQ